MSKYFLGSVGSAEAFRNTYAGRQLAFVCKTLTDSSINISTTKDDLRGGTGAPIVTNFYHDPNVEITLTDIFWKESYLEAQLGTAFQAGSQISNYYSDPIGENGVTVGEDGKIELTKTPIALKVACETDDNAIVWYTKMGAEEWHTTVADGNKITIDGASTGDKYCIRYLATDEQAREALITSNIIPEELYLIVTTPIFFGDACSISNGKLAGSLTFEIPRFKLNGAQNFSFNMSSNTTMELSGTALADFNGCDMINGRLVRVIESIEGRTLNDGLIGIIVDAGTKYALGTHAPLYGIYENGTVAILSKATTEGNNPNTEIVGVTSDQPDAYCENGIIYFGNNGSQFSLTYYTGGVGELDMPYFETAWNSPGF